MILLNDQLISRDAIHIDLEDRGYQFGDGLYEVVRVYKGKPFRFEDHFVRFERSARELRISLPVSLDVIKKKILELIDSNGLAEGIVYFQLTRGVSPRNHAFPEPQVTSILTAYTKEVQRPEKEINNGVKVVTVEDIRWLRCDIKSINLLGNVLAKQYAAENQAKEAIQIRDDRVTEGSASNFFIIKNKEILTHPANNYILRGITRNVVEEIANKLAIPFKEKEFTLEEAYQADEAFITSTTVEIMPVLVINDNQISSKPGMVTKSLQTEFNQFI